MCDDKDAEKIFTLNAMKFVFELCASPLPKSYKKELEGFNDNHPTLLTEGMKQAVIFLHDDFFSMKISPDDIESEVYKDALEKLELEFCLGDFLKFMAWNLVLCAYERSEEMLARIYYDMIAILKSKSPITKSWTELDKIATKYNKSVDVDDRRLNYTGLYKVVMEVDKKFLLKLIDYVFLLHFRDLPQEMEVMVHKISPYENDPFTNNVTHAVAILLNNQVRVIQKLGERGLVDYYYDLLLRSFTERDFLEFCVSHSRRACYDFYNYDSDSPSQTYKRMKRVLKGAKINRRFTTWDKIEDAALQLIKDDIDRTEDEQKFQEKYKPSMRSIRY